MRKYLMQQEQEYGQSPQGVKASLRQHKQQTHRANVRIGQERVRVSGDFKTIMGWVRLALAEMEVVA